jgi:Do/DeqQ family serine protease
MKTLKMLHSRKFFYVNLALLGAVAGFCVAAAVFLGAGAKAPPAPLPSLQAQVPNDLEAPVKAALEEARQVQSAFRYIAGQVTPTVVEVRVVEEAKVQQVDQNQWPWRFFFGEPENDQDNTPSIPRTERGVGSGVIVERKGDTYYVITNNHVADNAKQITIVLSDKREFKGSLVGTDKRRDLAVVSFEAKGANLPLARLGDSDAVRVGDWAIAVGNPLGLSFSVTTGTISALGRETGPDGTVSDYIQTDAAINQGNSGGALVNIDGEVIGINTWIASPNGGSIGLGFALPINNLKKPVRDIIDKKTITYGWLGVRLAEADADFLRSLGIEGRTGAFVEQVANGSPAEKGGILPGDFIVGMDKRELKSYAELSRLVGDTAAGTKVEFTLIRSGKERKLSVKLEERDEKRISDNSIYWPGLILAPAGSESLEGQDIKAPEGAVVVLSVIPKTAAAGLGLTSLDVITEVNGKKVKNLAAFYEALNASGDKLSIGYSRDGQEYETPILKRSK